MIEKFGFDYIYLESTWTRPRTRHGSPEAHGTLVTCAGSVTTAARETASCNDY